jgi:nucleoside-diphosphate-sugar epimerase
MLKILITGSNGYVGKSLKKNLNDYFSITSISRTDFDLCNSDLVNRWFKDKSFDVVLNCAAIGGSRIKTENHSIRDQNLKMYQNLLSNKDKFGRFIDFGSGAEFFHQTFYSQSKREIAESIRNTDNFYNIRIFGVFDENEIDTRFIKANIIRYINKEPIVIHTNKIMDFFYMKDLIALVKHYILSVNPNKEVNCSYENKYTLKNVANMINSLGEYTVPITVQNTSNLEFYCGESNLPKIDTFGIEAGIEFTYQKLFMMRN